MTPDLSVLIVAYNSAPHLPSCLASLSLALRGLDAEILVHDNASTDDTATYLRSHTQIQTQESPINIGFAAACNSLARISRGRYLWFLNPDTTVDPQAAQQLLEAAERHPAAGLYGARTVTSRGDAVGGSAQGTMTIRSLACFATGLSTMFPGRRWTDPESLPGWDRRSSRTVPALSGGALMVRRDAWAHLGGFDTRYFMYAEDIDLCTRAWRAGFRPMFVAGALVEHEVGGSSSPDQKLVLLNRGKVTFMRKLWPTSKATIGVELLVAGVGLRAAAQRMGLFPDRPGRLPGSAWLQAWKRRDEWRAGWPST
ncbi:glycosyltransferase family 2 protein [Geodermatophilus sp. DSM 44513]|uniref:glycosyltransferase family 2 protein n=1 Tax=Geodermatophilus sp. DSM 44513 TaxID=1528104 RepID=UPI001270D6FA|nr:glycosyltransferase family 2 protein [Geodermatophilus sp. DSM 44513]WNV76007.1 glycosyltransferase family 2 protein [Geodermatophilus sp. DSM 44513]